MDLMVDDSAVKARENDIDGGNDLEIKVEDSGV
jgi:hypothetical protein